MLTSLGGSIRRLSMARSGAILDEVPAQTTRTVIRMPFSYAHSSWSLLRATPVWMIWFRLLSASLTVASSFAARMTSARNVAYRTRTVRPHSRTMLTNSGILIAIDEDCTTQSPLASDPMNAESTVRRS